MLLVESLHEWVDETAEGRIAALLDDFSTSFAGVVFGNETGQAENIHCVGGRELVGASEDKFEAILAIIVFLAAVLGVVVKVDAHRAQQRCDDEFVVPCSLLDKLDRCFQVV